MKKNVHIFRYGTNADQKFISQSSKTFDLLAINGNMMSHAPKALSSFIVNLKLKDSNLGYFIDPITHSFQHDIKHISSFSSKSGKLEVKSSISKLIDTYGEPVKSSIEQNKSIKPSDFNDNKVLDDFCKAVADFQLTSVQDKIRSSDLDEFLSFENEKYSNDNRYSPEFIIAPYFFIDHEDWIDINNRAIASVIRQYPENKVFAQIVVPNSILLDEILQTKIIEMLMKHKLDGVLIWIDEFSEHDKTFEELEYFIEFLKKLRTLYLPIYNLYGSFFSVMLTSPNFPGGALLSGVGHGLEYGESRKVIPVGGGIPNNKFYYYKFHNRLDYKVMTEIIFHLGLPQLTDNEAIASYFKKICDCKVCKQVMKDSINDFQLFESTLFYEMKLKGTKQRRSYADRTTKSICVMHYQANKAKEFRMVNANSDFYKNILEEIDTTINEHSNLPDHLANSQSHLYIWKDIIVKHCGDALK